MNATTRRLLGIAALIITAAIPLFFLFRVVYAPQLTLRRELRRETPDPAAVSTLAQLALEDRFDLTDSMRLIHWLENQGELDRVLSLFGRLKDRFPEDPAIRLWYADRLQRYEHWGEADRQYRVVLDLLEREDRDQAQRRTTGLRVGDAELLAAQRAAVLHIDELDIVPDEVYRRMAENALNAGLSAVGPQRELWLEKSEAYFSECIRLNPLHYEARGAYARLLLESGRARAGLEQYRELLETDPDDLGWLHSAALAAAADHQFALAEQYVREALRVAPSTALRLNLARVMSWGGKHDAALEEIRALTERYPEVSLYRLERSQMLLNAGRHREFLVETARLAAEDPLNIGLRLNRVRAMTGLGRFTDAAHEASAVLALEPEHREAAILKAEALLWQGDYRAAQADLALLHARAPDDRRVQLRRAQSYLWDRRYDPAVRLYRKLDPASLADAEVSQGYAEAVAGMGQPSEEDAVTIRGMTQEITLQVEVSWPVPLLAALGRALRAVGDDDSAVQLLDRALLHAQRNLKLRLELADLLHDMGRHDEAGRQYRLITEPVRER